MFTVFGHSGFIGSHVVSELKSRGIECLLPDRNENTQGKELGKIIYCIGLTADAKTLPFETIEAHISKLSRLVQNNRFSSITYASSTRIYIHNETDADEDVLINVDVSDPFELFNLTKLTAESLLRNAVKEFNSIRYSNVFGIDVSSDNFLTSIIKDAIRTGKVLLNTTPDSAKDYISVHDAARLTVDISLSGRHNIYNVASGYNTTNEAIAEVLKSTLPCEIIYAPNARKIVFPEISVKRIASEYPTKAPKSVLDEIPSMVSRFKYEYNKSWN